MNFLFYGKPRRGRIKTKTFFLIQWSGKNLNNKGIRYQIEMEISFFLNYENAIYLK